MITFSRSGPTSFRVSGMTSAIPAGAWAGQLMAAAARLQRRIADGYRSQRVAGTRWLLPAMNPQYIRWKHRVVGHNRRGHLFEGIQGVLDNVQLWTLSSLSGSKVLSARINMSESIFRSQLDYIKHYEKSKVPGARILHLADSWIRAEETKLREWERWVIGETVRRQTPVCVPLARGKRAQIESVLRSAGIKVPK